MTSELKRAMKLMWGRNEKIRWACGCSLIFLSFFLALAYLGECFFFTGRNSAYMINKVRISSFSTGTFSCMCFLFYSIYGNGKAILSGMGKWLCGSKLAKSVVVKGVLVNRAIFFGVMFVPCLISRIGLCCIGHRDYAGLELFLLVWGAVYLLSAISAISECMFIVVWLLYMVSISWGKFWSFTEWFHLSLEGATLVFAVCLIGGTLLEKHILEHCYKNRRVRTLVVFQKGLGGSR